MALPLTVEEERKVTRARRNESELPTYFDAGLQTPLKISRDFEAYLVLANPDLKESAIRWINQVVSLQQARKDRDALAEQARTKEQQNAQARIADLDGKLQQFEQFRTNFQIDTKFSQIPEVQKLITDLQKVVEDLASERERSQYDDTMSQVISVNQGRFSVTQPQIEQLQSWRSVLSEYLRS